MGHHPGPGRGRLEDDLNAIGAPIYGPKHALLGAVSISGLAFGVPDETASEIVGPPKEAATGISRCPGYDAAD